MKIRLKQPGIGRNHYVTVTVKATMGPLDHLGKAADHQVRGAGSSKTKLSVSDTAQKSGSVSLDGRVNTPVTDTYIQIAKV